MSTSEIERLEREIAERQERLEELTKTTVTREELAAMSPSEIAKLDPAIVNRALEAA
jgi:uncharacterized protein (DUF3084 family)